ncbi:M20/M25/M40 family metallo-hydrolase [Candidatus Bathyarchaeota archaeon]|nr:M20/M25/M40 family metallo-hydrolase [Candidatus Bathyarchaeota archaeon]
MDNEASIRLLQDMLEIYSPSGKEQKLANFLKDEIANLGFENVRTDDAGNIYGEIGSGSPSILLCGHMDTVAGWIPIKREEDLLYGRGAVDAKSSLAAMISASQTLKPIRKTGKVIVAGVVEEESTANGIRQLLRENLDVNYAIFGEPSGVKNITFAYKGRVSLKIKFQTTSGHIGAQHLLDNAVEKAFELWNEIKTELNDKWSQNGIFDSVTTCLVKIRSQRTSGGVPDVCFLDFDLRLPPYVTTDQSIKAVRDVFTKYKEKNPNVSISHHVVDRIEPFMADKNTLLMKALERAILETVGEPFKFLKKTGTGDMNIFGAEVKVPVATYGPGDSSLSHTENERIKLSEYLTSIQVYKRAIEHLFSWHKHA